MFIIGERINGMFRSVARAIAERDEAAIRDLARRQVEAGAHALDVNTGPTEGDPVEVMRWLVDTIQSVVDVPLAIDSAKIPVINALTDLSHPCQAMADFLTLREHKGSLANLKLAYIGDGNNVCHSLMLAAARGGTERDDFFAPKAVSYTHLTLPTICSV